MHLFDRLKNAASADWASYVDHSFVRQMGEGTLPHAAFQTYLEQDYLFLIQFSRAYALAGYKSRTLEGLRYAQSGMSLILNEMELHVRLCERWGITRQELENLPELQSTIAYTRYVLDCGNSGDLLDLHVALSPCVIGYAEIGAALAPKLQGRPDHPYIDWIGEYAGQGYQDGAEAAKAYLDELASKSMSEARFDDLVKIFAKASRLEADFWQMGLDNPKV